MNIAMLTLTPSSSQLYASEAEAIAMKQKHVARPAQTDRTSAGKTSPRSTQGTGPRPTVKQKVKSRRQMRGNQRPNSWRSEFEKVYTFDGWKINLIKNVLRSLSQPPKICLEMSDPCR